MTSRSGVEHLRDRASFSWLRERDIDLLLCSELHARQDLTKQLTRIWSDPDAVFDGAWVSHAEFDGESDLIVAFRSRDRSMILLIENKISASFQPDQALRYQERAMRWRNNSRTTEVMVALLAPQEYISRPGSDQFDIAISYEDIIDHLKSSEDPRSNFLADALADGIASYRQGYVAVPDARVSDVWTAIWSVAQSETPQLNMPRPTMKPGRSTWIYFNQAAGFTYRSGQRVVVAFKAERGQVDLQFSRMEPSALQRLLAGLVEPDMQIVRASKSASVRLSVPEIDFGVSGDEQTDAIRTGLAQAERLRRFFVDNRIAELLNP